MTVRSTHSHLVLTSLACCLSLGLAACSSGSSTAQPLDTKPLATPSAVTSTQVKQTEPLPTVESKNFKSTAVKPVSYQRGGALNLTPNYYSAVKQTEDDRVIYNDREYLYDTTAGATVIPSRKPGEEKPAERLDPTLKKNTMFWSVQAPVGLISGEYYHLDKRFNEGPHQDKADDQDYFLGTTDLVISSGKILHIEFDEIPAKSYYNKTWAGQTKRRSGYAFFQADKPRTDTTLVTWVNGQTFLESQILKHNSLNLIFDTVHGSSNSARDVFIPSALELAEKVAQPSGQYYIGLSTPELTGLAPRLELIFEGDKIVKARYDEIFADTEAEIQDPALKAFYRQSKLDSVPYAEYDQGQFRQRAQALAEAFVKAGVADLSLPAFDDLRDWEAFSTLEKLVEQMKPEITRYLKEGYTHEAGQIGQRPAGMTPRPDQVDRREEIEMTLLNTTYAEDQTKVTCQVRITNKSDTPYAMTTGSFYMYVKNKDNIFDTLGDSQIKQLEVPAKGELVIDLTFAPLQAGDSDMALKYDGRNKVYASMVLPPKP